MFSRQLCKVTWPKILVHQFDSLLFKILGHKPEQAIVNFFACMYGINLWHHNRKCQGQNAYRCELKQVLGIYRNEILLKVVTQSQNEEYKQSNNFKGKESRKIYF